MGPIGPMYLFNLFNEEDIMSIREFTETLICIRCCILFLTSFILLFSIPKKKYFKKYPKEKRLGFFITNLGNEIVFGILIHQFIVNRSMLVTPIYSAIQMFLISIYVLLKAFTNILHLDDPTDKADVLSKDFQQKFLCCLIAFDIFIAICIAACFSKI